MQIGLGLLYFGCLLFLIYFEINSNSIVVFGRRQHMTLFFPFMGL